MARTRSTHDKEKKHFSGYTSGFNEKAYLGWAAYNEAMITGDMKMGETKTRHYFFMSQLNFCKMILSNDPDVLVLSCFNNRKGSPNYIDIRLLKKLKNIVNSKFIGVWWDTCNPGFVKSNILPFKGIIDLHVLCDNPTMDINTELLSKSEKKSIICESASYDPDGLFRQSQNKDIDVSFMGLIGSYRDYRKEYIDFLKSNNIKGVFSRFQR